MVPNKATHNMVHGVRVVICNGSSYIIPIIASGNKMPPNSSFGILATIMAIHAMVNIMENGPTPQKNRFFPMI